ncbi:MAG: adenosylcobinamide-GDP ribazoletransferase [Mariprofundaceae bacterium]|nr:adenosylcobinamide-GDP ribazoletransferase [Mariprofundaceae bacterium]
MQGLIAALRWMTTLPMPNKEVAEEGDMQTILPWLPITGLVVGLCVVLACYTGSLLNPWLGALLGTLVWMLVTGGLHADGLADLVDALGASHGNAERFIAVLKDPHIGSFGVLALIFLVVGKLILLKFLIDAEAWWGLLLIPMWARLGVLFWCRLPALTDGFAAQLKTVNIVYQNSIWLLAMIILSLFSGTLLWLAIGIIYLWHAFLKYRVKGMNGDCLGAGIECSEIVLLGLLLI